MAVFEASDRDLVVETNGVDPHHEMEGPDSPGLSLPGVAGRKGLGWLRDHPSPRDYTMESSAVSPLLEGTGVPEAAGLPAKVDLR